MELEFIQCLANPSYLNFLAQEGYFEEQEFIDFLSYLKSYWSTPKYAKFIVYPHCLKFLDLILQSESFRKELKRSDCTMYIHKQQYSHWLTYINNRMQMAGGLANSNSADEYNSPMNTSD